MSRGRCLSMFIALGFALVSCGVEDLKYSAGKDDPALGVTEADLEEVDRLLARQESIDRERGLRGADFAKSAASAESVAAPPEARETPSERRESAETGSTEPGKLDLKVLTATKPEGWIVESPTSSMRAGQFVLPAAESGGEDASLVVYYFGEDQGGTVEANLNRWFGQFEQPDGRPTSEVAEVEDLKAGSMNVTWADFSGTMQAASTPGMPATESKNDWRMIVAIVESPRGLVFFRATGPIATIGLHRDRIRTFVTSAAPIR